MPSVARPAGPGLRTVPAQARSRTAALLAACVLLVQSCAETGRPRAPLWPLPDPAQAPFEGERLQDVELRGPRGGAHFLAVLQHEGGTVVLVGLSPLGQRLVRATWSAAGVTVDTALEAAPYLDADLMLRELAFALWPRPALEAALQGGPCTAEFGPGRRSLLVGGKPVLEVEQDAGGDPGLTLLRRPGHDGEVRVRELKGVQP